MSNDSIVYIPTLHHFKCDLGEFYCYYDGHGWVECPEGFYSWMLLNGAKQANCNIGKIESIIIERFLSEGDY